MRIHLFSLVAIVGLVLATPAQAYLRMHGATSYQWEWAKEAQEHVPLADVSLWVNDGDPQYNPGTWDVPATNHNELDIPFDNASSRKLGWTLHAEQGDFLHELGHAYDFAEMTPARRAEFKQIAETTCEWWAKHCITQRWVSGPGVTVDIAPGEMFAEEYAACALGLTQRGYQDAGYNTYGWVPPQDNPNADQELCALIRGA